MQYQRRYVPPHEVAQPQLPVVVAAPGEAEAPGDGGAVLLPEAELLQHEGVGDGQGGVGWQERGEKESIHNHATERQNDKQQEDKNAHVSA